MADDLLQTLFVRAIEHADDLRDRPEHDRLAWLFKAARRLAIDHIRRRAAASRAYGRYVAERATKGQPIDPLQDLVAIETRGRIAAAIRRLPPELRATLRLHGLTGDAAAHADRLGVATSTVRWRLSVARSRVREQVIASPDCADVKED